MYPRGRCGEGPWMAPPERREDQNGAALASAPTGDASIPHAAAARTLLGDVVQPPTAAYRPAMVGVLAGPSYAALGPATSQSGGAATATQTAGGAQAASTALPSRAVEDYSTSPGVEGETSVANSWAIGVRDIAHSRVPAADPSEVVAYTEPISVSDAARTHFAVAPAITGQGTASQTVPAAIQPDEAPARGAALATIAPLSAAEAPAAAAMAEAPVKYQEEVYVAATTQPTETAAAPPYSTPAQAALPAPVAATPGAASAASADTAAETPTATDSPPASDAPAAASEAIDGNRSRKHCRTPRPRAQRGRGRSRALGGQDVSFALRDGRSDPKEIEVKENEPLIPPGRSRTNPKRRCRCRAAPLATTIEWTRMQVAHCKNLAEVRAVRPRYNA